jgi:hypothetical protein
MAYTHLKTFIIATLTISLSIPCSTTAYNSIINPVWAHSETPTQPHQLHGFICHSKRRRRRDSNPLTMLQHRRQYSRHWNTSYNSNKPSMSSVRKTRAVPFPTATATLFFPLFSPSEVISYLFCSFQICRVFSWLFNNISTPQNPHSTQFD